MAKPSTFFNMVSTLFVICLVSSAALGVASALTKEPIAKAALAKRITAIKQVLPEFDNEPLSESSTISVDGGS
ncbi:MAG TPA: RnfABCDGE type electron transport complex subunit G, partial [Candidatus Omnitrophota bacterium]|nr:RnfABCDGE type electron transport complex subunit G [Candidatus Omnitrophota bacterium]